MKHKIARRLVFYFLTVLFLFSLVTGFLFLTIVTKHAADLHEQELKERALSIATTLSQFPGPKGRGPGMGGGYGAYLRFIDDIAMSEVWLVDEQADTILMGHMGDSLSCGELPPEAEAVVGRVFQGDVEATGMFSSLIGEPSITVGAPVRDSNGDVRFALLLHSRVDGLDRVQRDSAVIFILCLCCALFLSFVLSILLARRFVKPLEKMRAATTQLIRGEYFARTNVTQNDEIGVLASNIDDLSRRLSDAEKERAKLDGLRRDFISNISHELRTPVTVLKGSLEVLDEGLITDKEEIRGYLRQMLKDTAYLQRLVNDLLDLSRLQNTDFKIEKAELNLDDVLTEAVRSMRHIAEKKQVDIILENTVGAVLFPGDYARLRQMLTIILDNAVKFSPPEEKVKVRMYEENNAVVISICDNGRGILAEDLPYIFDRFYRERAGRNESGTGLGLSIAKQIAQRHGVKISCESGLDKGACFKVLFRVSHTSDGIMSSDRSGK